jgi:predicted nuclease with TOPRIM domain
MVARNDMDAFRERLAVTERNQSDLAKSITEIISEVNELRKPLEELRTDREVRKERDTHLNARLERMEATFKREMDELKADMGARWSKLQAPLWTGAAALISAIVVTFWQFVVKGGLNVGP